MKKNNTKNMIRKFLLCALAALGLAAGATVPVGMSPERMKTLITNEGLTPVERDALYERFS